MQNTLIHNGKSSPDTQPPYILVPEGIHAPEALLAILSCDAAKGVLKLNPEETDKVLVSGMGTMGLLTVHFLKEYMNVHHVDIIEPNPSRRNLALQFGAKSAFDTFFNDSIIFVSIKR